MKTEVDILRHILSIFVIIQHMPSTSRYSAAVNGQLIDVGWWVNFAVIGFFMLSGGLFKPKEEIGSYIKSQTIRLIVPFLFFGTIYNLSLLYLNKIQFNYSYIYQIFLGGGFQMYFLLYLFMITNIYASLKIRNPKYDLALFIVALGISLLLPGPSATGPSVKLIPLYFSAFFLGRFLSHIPNNYVYSILIYISIFSISMFDNRMIAMSTAFILVYISLNIRTNLPARRLPGSGGVYLLHSPLINFGISTLLMKINVTEWSNIIISVILTYLVALGITLFVIRVAPRYRWMLLE